MQQWDQSLQPLEMSLATTVDAKVTMHVIVKILLSVLTLGLRKSSHLAKRLLAERSIKPPPEGALASKAAAGPKPKVKPAAKGKDWSSPLEQ